MQTQGGEGWETGLEVRVGDEQEGKPGHQEVR